MCAHFPDCTTQKTSYEGPPSPPPPPPPPGRPGRLLYRSLVQLLSVHPGSSHATLQFDTISFLAWARTLYTLEGENGNAL